MGGLIRSGYCVECAVLDGRAGEIEKSKRGALPVELRVIIISMPLLSISFGRLE